MKRKSIAFMILVFMFSAMTFMIASCKEDKKDNSKAMLLLMGASSRSAYFPEIPKGVAE